MSKKIRELCEHCDQKEAKIFRSYPTDQEDIIKLCVDCSKLKICVVCETQPIDNNRIDLCFGCHDIYGSSRVVRRLK